jgi:DNA-directed RNA polymerase specialized sigma subunit, sigma24 homolog
MSLGGNSGGPVASRARHFATTRWTIVLAAGRGNSRESSEALAALCQAYWFPVYSYARRMSASTADAQDLTQAFFAHLLEKAALAKADPERGRFRTFLLAALVNFLANERDKERAQKRGGGRPAIALDFTTGESRHQIEPAHDLTPDRLFERRWALALVEQVLEMLRAELAAGGKEGHFDQLKGALIGEMTGDDYERASEQLGISPAAAKQAAYRLRKRYRELFRLEVARTVADDSEVDDEIGRLMEILSG